MPREMGKAAENEKIKLRAALLNNCAVGLTVAGVFLPLLAMISTRISDRWVIVLGLVACLLALWAAGKCHKGALKELDKLED